MLPSVETRIRDLYAELPARERKLADVLLDMHAELPAYSATELAARAGVSKATAARLFRRLGFTDFAEMRQTARAARAAGSPLDALASAGSGPALLAAHIARDVQNLTQVLETLDADAAAGAVVRLADARRLFVVGFRNNHALALYARGLLAQLRPDVLCLPQGGYTVAEDLATLGPEDAVLALAFRRRLPVMADILRRAEAAGAGLVVLGDPTLTVEAGPDALVLRCPCRGASLFDSYAAAMSVLSHLCSGVALALGPAAEAQLERVERLHDAFGDFPA